MIDLRLGNSLDVLPMLPDASVDCVITDPPYPEISRPYGRMTEAEWHAMMHIVVPECRRVLKPRGSAVFVLQPNSRKVGSMRPWLWEFMAWCCHEWNMVQDAWWWNPVRPPTVHSQQVYGLMRPSVKVMIWLGAFDCFRDQDKILWSESESNKAVLRCDRALRRNPSGNSMRAGRCASSADIRGGVTPFNLVPIANTNSISSAGSNGHGAGMPFDLCDWWTRYISPEGGTILDPFMGSGTTGLAALARNRDFIGIEKSPEYFAIAEKRLNSALNATPLFPGDPIKIIGKGQPVG